MKKVLLTVVALSFLMPLNAYTGDLTAREWRGLSVREKAYYLRGLTDGVELYASFIKGSGQEPVDIDDVIPLGVTYGENIDALDEFYADERNSLIPTNTAIAIIKQKMKGEPDQVVDLYVESAREGAGKYP